METHVCKPSGPVYQCSCGQAWRQENGIYRAVASFVIRAALEEEVKRLETEATTKKETVAAAKNNRRLLAVNEQGWTEGMVLQWAGFYKVGASGKEYFAALDYAPQTHTWVLNRWWGKTVQGPFANEWPYTPPSKSETARGHYNVTRANVTKVRRSHGYTLVKEWKP